MHLRTFVRFRATFGKLQDLQLTAEAHHGRAEGSV
jgi:hypothetical protein